jgi:glycine/D-amino acid oxidase-like deaminating enzyme
MTNEYTAEVAVVGAGVFGAWAAYKLRQAGAEVLLVDAMDQGIVVQVQAASRASCDSVTGRM